MKSTESNAARSFGITQVGYVPWGTHLCQFYESKQDLVDILVPYFAKGLRSNEFCMWVTSQPLEVAEAKKALAKVIPDVDKYLRRGQLEVVSYSDWYLQDGKFDCNRVLQGWVEKEKNALKNGFEGLRLTGNTFWIERNLWQSFVDYEEAINSVIGEHKMLALCTYCLTNCSGTDVLDVVRNHVGTLLKQGDKWVLVENVLGRKKAEAQISEQLQMLDLAHIIVKNMNDEIIFWNTGAQKLYGFSKEEALKRIPRQLLKTKFPIPIQQIKQELLRSGNWEGELIHTKADGNQITVASHWTLHRDNKGTPVAIIEVNNDITELKKAEKEIERLASFPTLNPNAIFEADFEGKIVYCNPATKKLFPDFEDLGKNHPFLSDWNHAVKPFSDKTKSTVGREVNVAGHWYYETLYFVPQTEKIRVYAVDIDELKKAEEALSKSEQRWSTTLSSIGDAVIATDVAGKISFMNLEAEELTGWTASEASQRPVNSIFKIVNEQTRLEVENPIDRVLREGMVVGLANHTVLIRKDGSEIPIDDSGAPIKDKEGKTTGVVLVFRDITERKQQERALENTAKFPSQNPNPVFRVNRNGIILYGNQAGASFLTAWNSKVGEHAPENISRVVAEALASNKRIEIEETYEAKIFLLLFGPVTLENYVNIYAIDITERKKGEEALSKLYRHQRAVSNSNQALMHATDENLLTQQICDIIINDCGYSLVWVGFAEHDQNKTVHPVAFAGFDKGYIDALKITWDENSERGRGPTGTVIRTGKPYVCRNTQIDPNFMPWRPEARKRGYTASLVLPLLSFESETFGALNIYSKESDPFTDEEVKLLTELANDFAYGIMMLRMRKEREQAEETLRKQASLIDLTPDAIIVQQLDGTISFWNKGAEKLYGWTKDEAISQKINTLLKTEFPQPLAEIMNIVKLEGKWSGEIVHTCKDGTKVVEQSFWLAKFGADGKIVELLESNVDITQRIELQVKLEESAVRVEEYANQMEELANKRAE